MQPISRIASFSIDHDKLLPGLYVSRIDGDIVTYDMRTRRPNTGDLMDNATMHSLEHMFATFIRNGALGPNVIYFGPMGCQTGFYLLMRDVSNDAVLAEVKSVCERILNYDGPVFGAARKECGNYANLDLECAKVEARRYLAELNARPVTFAYEE